MTAGSVDEEYIPKLQMAMSEQFRGGRNPTSFVITFGFLY